MIEIDLSGRVAFVTGGSRGLGRADALTLGRAGADVVIADIQVESDPGEESERYGRIAQAARAQGFVYAEATAQEICDMGRLAAAVKCDVTEREQVEEAVRRTVDEFGSVDILVNNAGTLDHLGQLPDQVAELWERDLRVNLTGAFNCTQAVWPHMQERGWGRIVNMASVAGTLGGFGQASYSTTKAGLLGLTRTLALEGARHGITCNAIVPGIIGTEDRGLQLRQSGDERTDGETDRDAPRGRAAGRRQRDRLPLFRPGLVHHRRRAQRQRRHRALHVLAMAGTASMPAAFGTRPSQPWVGARHPDVGVTESSRKCDDPRVSAAFPAELRGLGTRRSQTRPGVRHRAVGVTQETRR